MSVVMVAPAFGIQLPDAFIVVGNPTSEITLDAPNTGFLSIEEYAEAAAHQTAIDPVKFKKLITCESVWKEDAAGDHGTSLGILQFKHPTFEMFNERYGFEGRDIMNPHHQIDLAVQMIRDGYIYHWKNCGRKIGWIPSAI